MKRVLWGVFLAISASLLIIGCTTVHQFKSGDYILAVKQTTSAKNMPKNVKIIVTGEKIEVQNLENEEVLSGTIKGNEISIFRRTDSDNVEFIGRLVANNQAAGKVIQKSDSSVVREAEFTITKLKPKSKIN